MSYKTEANLYSNQVSSYRPEKETLDFIGRLLRIVSFFWAMESQRRIISKNLLHIEEKNRYIHGNIIAK